jgi:hypothetical protein
MSRSICANFVSDVPAAVEETLQAGGLCVGHFAFTWVSIEQASDRDLLQDIQLRGMRNRIRRLQQLRQQPPSADEARQHLLEGCKRAGRSLSGWTVTRR